MITKLAAVVIFTPVFFLAGALVGILGAVCGRIYIGWCSPTPVITVFLRSIPLASQLSVKREQSNAKAPVLAQYELLPHSSV
jgi:hypothetical protein